LPAGQIHFRDVHRRLVAQAAQSTDGARSIAAANRFDSAHACGASDGCGTLLHICPQMQQVRRNVHGYRYRECRHCGNRYHHTQLAFDREVREPTKQ
jgi:hypothetical protein